jgi:hypothetical protein
VAPAHVAGIPLTIDQPRDSLERFGPKCQSDPGFAFSSGHASEELDDAETHGGYFCHVQNSGRIDPVHLDDESYADFGFLPPATLRTTAFSKQDGADVIAEETAHLDAATRGALLTYAEFDYADLNNFLRTGRSLERTDRMNELQRELMDQALDRRGLQRIVYRREGKKSADVAGLTLGDEIVHPAYISTSYDPHTSSEQEDEDFDSVVFEMKTSAGVNISNIAPFEETEVVLPRDLRFRVVGIHWNVVFTARKSQVPFDRGQSKPGTVSVYRSQTIVQVVEVDADGRIIG